MEDEEEERENRTPRHRRFTTHSMEWTEYSYVAMWPLQAYVIAAPHWQRHHDIAEHIYLNACAVWSARRPLRGVHGIIIKALKSPRTSNYAKLSTFSARSARAGYGRLVLWWGFVCYIYTARTPRAISGTQTPC